MRIIVIVLALIGIGLYSSCTKEQQEDWNFDSDYAEAQNIKIAAEKTIRGMARIGRLESDGFKIEGVRIQPSLAGKKNRLVLQVVLTNSKPSSGTSESWYIYLDWETIRIMMRCSGGPTNIEDVCRNIISGGGKK